MPGRNRRAFVSSARRAAEETRDIFRQEVNRQFRDARPGTSFCNGRVFLFWRSWRERKTPRTSNASALNSFLSSTPCSLPYFQSPAENVIFLRLLGTLHGALLVRRARVKYTKRHPFYAHASVMLFPFLRRCSNRIE